MGSFGYSLTGTRWKCPDTCHEARIISKWFPGTRQLLYFTPIRVAEFSDHNQIYMTFGTRGNGTHAAGFLRLSKWGTVWPASVNSISSNICLRISGCSRGNKQMYLAPTGVPTETDTEHTWINPGGTVFIQTHAGHHYKIARADIDFGSDNIKEVPNGHYVTIYFKKWAKRKNIVTFSETKGSRDQLDNKIENKSKSGEGKETKNRHGSRNLQFSWGALKLDNLAVQQWNKGDD